MAYSISYYTAQGRQLKDFDRNMSWQYALDASAKDPETYLLVESTTPGEPTKWLLAGRETSRPAWA